MTPLFLALVLAQEGPAARSGVGAAKIGSKAYIVGGSQERDGAFVRDLLSYDIAARKWADLAMLPEYIAFPVVEAYAGRLYVFGGLHRDGSVCNHSWVYDPTPDRFTALAPLPTPRSRASGAVVNGKIAVIGGIDADNINSNRVELYDPNNKTWSRIEPLQVSRHGQTSAFAKDAIIVLGGYSGNPMEQTTDVEVWKPNQGWKTASPMPHIRGFASTVVYDGKVYVFGTRGGAEHPSIYDPATDLWTESKAKDVPRHRGAVIEHGGRAYFFFGEEHGGKPIAVFDLARDAWIDRF